MEERQFDIELGTATFLYVESHSKTRLTFSINRARKHLKKDNIEIGQNRQNLTEHTKLDKMMIIINEEIGQNRRRINILGLRDTIGSRLKKSCTFDMHKKVRTDAQIQSAGGLLQQSQQGAAQKAKMHPLVLYFHLGFYALYFQDFLKYTIF